MFLPLLPSSSSSHNILCSFGLVIIFSFTYCITLSSVSFTFIHPSILTTFTLEVPSVWEISIKISKCLATFHWNVSTPYRSFLNSDCQSRFFSVDSNYIIKSGSTNPLSASSYCVSGNPCAQEYYTPDSQYLSHITCSPFAKYCFILLCFDHLSYENSRC